MPQEERGGGGLGGGSPGLPPSLLRVESRPAKLTSNFDIPLDTFRSQLNGHHDRGEVKF